MSFCTIPALVCLLSGRGYPAHWQQFLVDSPVNDVAGSCYSLGISGNDNSYILVRIAQQQLVPHTAAGVPIIRKEPELKAVVLLVGTVHYRSGAKGGGPAGVERESFPSCSRSPMARDVKLLVTEYIQ